MNEIFFEIQTQKSPSEDLGVEPSGRVESCYKESGGGT